MAIAIHRFVQLPEINLRNSNTVETTAGDRIIWYANEYSDIVM